VAIDALCSMGEAVFCHLASLGSIFRGACNQPLVVAKVTSCKRNAMDLEDFPKGPFQTDLEPTWLMPRLLK
jgi:hypothetical protein